MRRTRFDSWPCAIARTTDLIGDWWAPLIFREAFYGVRRFDAFERNLGLGRNVLTARLRRLVKEGLFTRERYTERPPRYEYILTDKGRALFPVIVAMKRWGDDWLFEAGKAPVELYDCHTGKPLKPLLVDETTGQPIELSWVRARPGPGFRDEPKRAAPESERFGPSR